MSNSNQGFQQHQIEIVFEDDHLLAVNKPAGLVVNDSQTTLKPTLQQWLSKRLGGQEGIEKIIKNQQEWQSLVPTNFSLKFGTPAEIFKNRQGLVHRLDKDTSGILLLAKNPGSLVNLLDQFKHRLVKKKYLCLVHGKFRVDSSAIQVPIARSKINRLKYRVEIDGRLATTYYRVIDYFPKINIHSFGQDLQAQLKKNLNSYQQGFSLVECLPETGRTHQIRVHLAHIHHPLVADRIYGGEKRSKLDQVWCPRQFLHAQQLQFAHPQTGELKVVSADIEQDLQKALFFLEK